METTSVSDQRTPRFFEKVDDLIAICEAHPFWNAEQICKAAGIGMSSFINYYVARDDNLKRIFGTSRDRTIAGVAERMADVFDKHQEWDDLNYIIYEVGTDIARFYKTLLPSSERLRLSYAAWKRHNDEIKGLSYYEQQLLKHGYSRDQIKRIKDPFGESVV